MSRFVETHQDLSRFVKRQKIWENNVVLFCIIYSISQSSVPRPKIVDFKTLWIETRKINYLSLPLSLCSFSLSLLFLSLSLLFLSLFPLSLSLVRRILFRFLLLTKSNLTYPNIRSQLIKCRFDCCVLNPKLSKLSKKNFVKK